MRGGQLLTVMTPGSSKIQIDLPDFMNGKQEWVFAEKLNLINASSNGIPFHCTTPLKVMN